MNKFYPQSHTQHTYALHTHFLHTLFNGDFPCDNGSKSDCRVKVGTRDISKRVNQSHGGKCSDNSTQDKIFRIFLSTIIDSGSHDDEEEEESAKTFTGNGTEELVESLQSEGGKEVFMRRERKIERERESIF